MVLGIQLKNDVIILFLIRGIYSEGALKLRYRINEVQAAI